MSEQIALEPLTTNRRGELSLELVTLLTNLKHLEETKKKKAKAINDQINSTADAIEELRVMLRAPGGRPTDEITDPEPMTTDEAEVMAAAGYNPEDHEPYIPDHQERAGIMADDVPGESFGLDALDVPDDKEV